MSRFNCLFACLVLCAVASAAEFRVEADEPSGLMTVPRKDPRFAIGSTIIVLNGTGFAWDRDESRIDIKIDPKREQDPVRSGFDLVAEARDDVIGIGFTPAAVEGYVKELAAFGCRDAYAVCRGFYPLDAAATVTVEDRHLADYLVIYITKVGATNDGMLQAFKVVKEIVVESRPVEK